MKTRIRSFKIMTILLFVGLIHILAMLFYTEYTNEQALVINKDQAIQQIVSLIQKLKSNPRASHEKIVKQFYAHYLQLSLTKNPEWLNQINDPEYEVAIEKIFSSSNNFSFNISSNQWLNVFFQDERHGRALQVVMLIMEGLLVFLLLYVLWIIERFNLPLRRFKKAADKLGIESLSIRVEEKGPLAIKQMAQALNQLQLRIKQLLEERTAMLVSISHDLRTPLTRLKLRSQFIEEKWQTKTLQDIDEMEKMISEVLYFAKDNAKGEVKTSIDLSSLLMTVCDDLQAMNIIVEFIDNVEPVIFYGQALALRRAINNLLINANRYANKITLTLKANLTEIQIIIDDNGPGIPAEKLVKVCQPFYRINEARTKEGPNMGLGLAITKAIVHSQGGKLSLQNLLPAGLRAVIHLPR